MRYLAKATTGGAYRRRNTIFIGILSLLAVVGIVMMIYSIVKGSWLFVASYFIALLLLITYIFIRINTVYATYLATNADNLYMRNWTNNFLPYDVDNKIKILSEFVPAKTKLISIPVDEVRQIAIGTKNYIKRNIEDNAFNEDVERFEKSKDFYQKRTISGMDIFYVRLGEDESYYMPIMNFNKKAVKKILNLVVKCNPSIELLMGSRDYRNFTPKN